MRVSTWTETRSLLCWGMVAGPLYLTVGLAQAFTRDGFDLARHSLSVLANGAAGWIQAVNLALTGLMVIAAAIGVRNALRPQSKAAGWILACFGIGMILGAIFPADPVDGFPPGTPEGFPTTLSIPGMIHVLAGAFGFLALAVSCLMVAVAMLRRSNPWMAGLSIISGVAIVIGFAAPALLPASGPVVGIWFSVVIGWVWLTLTCVQLYRVAPKCDLHRSSD